MSGLLLLAIAAVWIAIAVAAAVGLGKRLPKRWWSPIAVALLLFVLVPLPLVDEIAGKVQFERLCSQYAAQTMIDEQHAKGRRVLAVRRGADEYAKGTAVPIRVDRHRYRDAETGQLLVEYYTLHAYGGWLIRALGLSESNHPLLFDPACGPADQDGFKKRLNIQVVN